MISKYVNHARQIERDSGCCGTPQRKVPLSRGAASAARECADLTPPCMCGSFMSGLHVRKLILSPARSGCRLVAWQETGAFKTGFAGECMAPDRSPGRACTTSMLVRTLCLLRFPQLELHMLQSSEGHAERCGCSRLAAHTGSRLFASSQRGSRGGLRRRSQLD